MADFKKYREYSNSSGDFMKLKIGENKVRIVSEFEEFESEYQGKMKTRFMGYVIDREDGQIKPITIGNQIFGQIGELALSTDYGFDGLPPYDVTIKKVGEGIDTEYTVLAARQNSELTEAEKAQIEALKPVTDIIASMKKKNPEKFERKEVVLPNGNTLKDEDIPVIDPDETF
jgi:hypothetical protein